MDRRVVRSRKGWLCSALLLVGSLSGGGWAQGFTVSPARYLPPASAACDVVLPQLQTLERLLGMSSTPQLAFTRAIPLRQQEYAALESRLASLSVRALPYSPADLASLSRPSMPALRQEFTARYETVPNPDYLAGIVWLTMAAGMGYLTVSAYSEGAELSTVAAGGVLAVATGYLGLLALSLTRRVEHRDPIQSAISANAATRRQHEQEVAGIDRENAEREARRREQETVEAANRAVQEARRELAAAMNAFEPESRFVAERVVPNLDDMARRCLDRLIYGGAVARVGSSAAVVSLAVTPVNRAGAVMYVANPGQEFRFSVRDIGLFGGTGRVGGASDAVVRAVRPFDPGEFDVTPVTAVLIIDSSGSMTGNDPRGLRTEGVVRFLDAAPANAYIGLMQFTDTRGRVLAPISQNFPALRQAATRITSDNWTPLYAAGLDGLELLLAHGTTTRRVLVMLSDGDDNRSPAGAKDDLVRRAREGLVPIHAIGLGDVDFREFREVAEATGGSYVHARTIADVVTALEQLARALSAAYVIDVEVPVATRPRGADGEVGAVITAQHEGIRVSTSASGYIRLLRLD